MKKPEARLPTLDDVALVAGVSRATVSRAIRDTRRVAPELKELVERAIEQTGYVPNRAARSLATGRAHSIMIAVSGMGPEGAAPGLDTFGDPFFGRVIGGLARSLRARDRDPVLLLVESEIDRRAVISAARSGATDGALLVSTRADDPLPAAFAAANLPAVTFAAPPDGVALSFVDVANHEGGRLAATRLLERGAR
ncbi:MAG: LacI family DNA-binding transcriptional regulator, partial [Protaetiibacter sp.]